MPEDQNPPEIRLEDIESVADQPLAGVEDSIDPSVLYERIAVLYERIAEAGDSGFDQEAVRAAEETRTIKILNKLMDSYANNVFWFMCAYCSFVGLFLLMNAFGCFKIPAEASVLEFLVGSTAVTVIGLVGMVITGIFLGVRKKLTNS